MSLDVDRGIPSLATLHGSLAVAWGLNLGRIYRVHIIYMGQLGTLGPK